MTRTKRSQWFVGLTALLVLAVASYWMIPNVKGNAMNTASGNLPMHTLCVGRYLIDVPANYKFEHYNYRINGVDISWYFKAKDKQGFVAAVDERKRN